MKEKHKAILSDDMVLANLAYHDIYAKKSTADIIRCFMEDPEMHFKDVAIRCDRPITDVYHFVVRYQELGVIRTSRAHGNMYGRVEIDPDNEFGLWD